MKLRNFRKVISFIATFAVLINSVGAPLTVLAQTVEPSPTPEATETSQETASPEPTITPSEEPTATPESTPIETASPTPEVTPAATDEATAVPETPQPEIQSTTNENAQTLAPPAESPAITPTATPELPKEEGTIATTVVENIDLSAINLLNSNVDTATVTTDKSDYSPTGMVLITGTGFTAEKTYTIEISSTDEPPVVHSDSVTADSQGLFTYSYQLDGNYRPNYKIEIKNGEAVVASTTFTDTSCNGSSFDTFTLGSVNGQGGWSATGPYDQAIVDNTYGYVSFGCKSLRLSNGVTSGSFSDWIFSNSFANEAGETSAFNSGFSSGIRQNHFETQFDIASTTPGTQQSGLQVSVSPDRGDGGRMSYLRFNDMTDGIHVFFDDYFAHNFRETDIETLNRSVPHKIKFTMDFIDGANNDIVKVYLDDTLVHTGTSWEDYFRDNEIGIAPPTVDSLLIQARNNQGGNVPANLGKGFLFDNMNLSSSTISPDTSGFVFVGSPKYVRAGNAGDESARILVSNQATDAQFFVDGSITPISGIFVGPSTSTTEWWKLKTALTAGEHTITAQAKIGSNWYDVNGSGIAYSIELPWAEYVIPQANQYFRLNDKVVRVRADDEFNQFDHMITTINSVNYTVNRSSCTDQGNDVLCDLQDLNLDEGVYTATTTTYTKANNRVDNLISQSFIIDNTRPTLSNFVITDLHSVYSANVSVSADANDGNGIKNVTFYLTAPRIGDEVCDGNGTQLSSTQGTLVSGSTYGATLDSSALNGDYCLNAIAEDMAANHSLPILHIKATFDNVAPDAPTLESPANGAFVKPADLILDWSDITDPSSPVSYYYQSSYSSAVGLKNALVSPIYTSGALLASQIDASGSADNTYYWQVKACDSLNNCSDWSDPWEINIDNTAPAAPTILAPLSEQAFKNTPILNSWSVVDDVSGIREYRVEYIYDDGHTFSGAPYRTAASTQRNHIPGITEQGGVTIRVQAIDNAGNEGAWSNSRHYYYDATPPAAPSLIAPTNNSVVPGGSLTNSWSTVPDATKYIYESYYDSGATSLRWNQEINAPTTSKTATNVADTTFWWRVRAIDAAGNIGPWSNLWKVTVDNISPDVEITSPETSLMSGITTIRGTVTDANPHHYWLVIQNSSGNTVAGPGTVNDTTSFTDKFFFNWDTLLVPDGEYTIKLEARDAAENKDSGSVDWNSIVVDNTAPNGSWVTPINSDPPTIVSGMVSLDFSATDDSGIASIAYAFSADGVNFSDIPGSNWNTIVLALGEYTLRATVTDNAGNSANFDQIVGVAAVISAESSNTFSTTGATVSWTTDRPTKSRVVYDTVQHPTLDLTDPNFGYAYSTGTSDVDPKVLNHSVIITGLADGTLYYYRVVSEGSPAAIGTESGFKTYGSTGATLSGGGAGVLGISTTGGSWPKLAYAGTDDGTVTTNDVLGTETKETGTPAATVSENQTAGFNLITWVMGHKKISLGVILIVIAIGFYVRSRRK